MTRRRRPAGYSDGMDVRPANYNIEATRDSDVELVVSVFESDGTTARNISTATIVADVIDGAGAQVVAMGQSVGGAGNNELTLTLTDVNMGTGTLPLDRYRWVLEITEGTVTRPLLAGWFAIADRGVPGTGDPTTTARRRTVDDLVLSIV